MCGGYAEVILRRKTPEIALLFYFLRKCKKLSSARKIPKLRHFLHFCGGYPLFFRKSCKKNRKKALVSPSVSPPLVLFCYFYRFSGGVLPQNPKKARNCVVFAAEDIKKHLPQNAFQKPEKSPKLREKMIAEDMQRVSSALSSATSADFSRKFKRVVNYRSNTPPL